MKESLKYLPALKRDELALITQVILQNCAEVQMIILFGSYARGSFKVAEDLPHEQYREDGRLHTAAISDYDILVVTETKETAKAFFAYNIDAKLEHLSAPVQITTFDIHTLNDRLSDGQYFYSDIKKEGVWLYNSGQYTLKRKRQLTPSEKKTMARGHYKDCFETAEGFLDVFELLMERNKLKLAAFNLHQAAEHAYKTMILVFTSYYPKTHLLKKLGPRTIAYHPDLAHLFLRTSYEENERFELLEYAYIGGRYDPNFYMPQGMLELLATDVKRLIEITREVCLSKIASFDHQV